MTDHPAEPFLTQGNRIHVPDGTCLFRPGDESRAFLFVLSGSVRVEQTNAAGRTVVLYRVAAGDSCVLTTTGLLSGRPYSGYGYAEGDVTAVSIPAQRFRSLLSSEPKFQEIVFRNFAARVGELTDVIDDLLIHRTDQRIARWLADRAGPTIHVTQQELAQELGTVREVVSRTLKSFENRGWISSGRGTITVLQVAALAKHAEHA
ncbi:MAG: Crp/Fnr family transcriptional regulator [Ruegeria sp.]